jgi:hypothetical protein
MVNLNPNIECFVYDIFISWGHLLLMESFLGVAIEILKNDFLCVSVGMVFIGGCACLSGFFRPVTDSPAWINWMCYIFPLKVNFFLNLIIILSNNFIIIILFIKWSISGFLWQIFSTQIFVVSGSNPEVTISGIDILSSEFGLNNINSWGYFGVLLGYSILFRFVQYLLLSYQTGRLFSSK